MHTLHENLQNILKTNYFSPKTTRYSLLATRHSPLATRHSLLATRHSPLATRHSPLATRYSRINSKLVLVQDLSLPVFVIIELINWVALYTGQTAVKLGIPPLVSAIEASIPAYAFALSLFIGIVKRQIDRETRRKLPIKWGLVVLMMVGVWLIGANGEG